MLLVFIASKAKKQNPEVKALNEFIHKVHREDRTREALPEQMSASSPVKRRKALSIMRSLHFLALLKWSPNEPDSSLLFVYSFPTDSSSHLRAVLGTFYKAIWHYL